MAKDTIFQSAPVPRAPITPRLSTPIKTETKGKTIYYLRPSFLSTKRYKPIVDLSQHIRLNAGDLLQKGDEIFDDLTNTWAETGCIGHVVGTVLTYRRRIK